MIRIKPNENLFNFLKQNEIVNLNIMGFIENKPDSEIYVDQENSIQGVLVRNGYFNFLYTDKEEILDKILAEMFQKENEYGFSGTHRPITEKILKYYQQEWRNPCDIYYLPKEKLNIGLIKNRVQPVNIKNAKTIDSFYTYRDEDSLERIKEDIRERLSSAIYVNDAIVSWVLMHQDNSMGIMYTKEECRKKGYAVDVTINLASRLIHAHKTPYLQIHESNNQSVGLALKCGFVNVGKCDWFGVRSLSDKH